MRILRWCRTLCTGILTPTMGMRRFDLSVLMPCRSPGGDSGRRNWQRDCRWGKRAMFFRDSQRDGSFLTHVYIYMHTARCRNAVHWLRFLPSFVPCHPQGNGKQATFRVTSILSSCIFKGLSHFFLTCFAVLKKIGARGSCLLLSRQWR